jgi:hypothetical protein
MIFRETSSMASTAYEAWIHHMYGPSLSASQSKLNIQFSSRLTLLYCKDHKSFFCTPIEAHKDLMESLSNQSSLTLSPFYHIRHKKSNRPYPIQNLKAFRSLV